MATANLSPTSGPTNVSGTWTYSGGSDYTVFNEDPTTGQPDSDWAGQTATDAPNTTISATFGIGGGIPADFDAITATNTLRMFLVYTGFSDDSQTVQAQVFASNNSTLYTDQVTVYDPAGGTNSSAQQTASFTINATGLAASKADWEGALLRITLTNSKSKGQDNFGCRVHAVRWDINYATASASGTAALTGSATLAATGSVTHYGSAALTGSAALAAQPVGPKWTEFAHTDHSATTINLTGPQTVDEGDLMIAVFVSASDQATLTGSTTGSVDTIPTGWTEILAGTDRSASTDSSMHAFWKLATAADASAAPTTYAWGDGDSINGGAFIIRLTGVDQTTPIDDATFAEAVVSGSVVAPSITTSVDNTHLIVITGVDESLGTNAPYWADPPATGWRGEYGTASTPSSEDGGTNVNLGLAHQVQVSAGATGTVTVSTASQTDDNLMVMMLAVSPVITQKSGTAALTGSATIAATGTRVSDAPTVVAAYRTTGSGSISSIDTGFTHQDGDVLYAFFGEDNNTAGATTPTLTSGWTNLVNANPDTGTREFKYATWRKVVTSGTTEDSATYTLTGDSGEEMAVVFVQVRGADTTTPEDATTTHTGQFDSATADPPSITTQNADSLVLTFIWSNGVTVSTYTAPSGYTEIANAEGFGTHINTSAAWKEVATAGAENPGVWGEDLGSNDESAMITVAVRASSTSKTGTAALTGSATLAATGSVTHYGTAALTGSATLAATGTPTHYGTAALTGSATLAASGTKLGSAALTGAATLSATGTPTHRGSAALTGSATLTASGTKLGSAALTGTATLSATGSVTHYGQAALTGSATLAATGTKTGTQTGTAALTGSATLAATGTPTHYGQAALTGSATLTASGTKLGSAALTGTATLSATGSVTHYGQAALTGSATLAASGTKLGSAALTGTATLSATGSVTHYGSAALTGTATLAATGTKGGSKFGTAALTGSATLTASGTKLGSAALTGAATLSATGTATHYGSAALTGSATMTASGTKLGSAALTGTATLTATGTRIARGSVALTGGATLAVADTQVVRRATVALTGTATLAVPSTHVVRYAVLAILASATLNATGTGAGPIGSATITPPLRAVTRPRGHDPFDTMLRRIHRRGYYP